MGELTFTVLGGKRVTAHDLCVSVFGPIREELCWVTYRFQVTVAMFVNQLSLATYHVTGSCAAYLRTSKSNYV